MMEAQVWNELLQKWMERDWESWMREKEAAVVSDKELAIEAAEQAVEEMEKKWLNVSVSFLYFHIQS